MERLVIICIQLSLNNSHSDEIRNCIKGYGRWWHHIKNVWIVKTSRTIEDISNDLVRFLSSQDSLLVSVFNTADYDGFLTEDAFDWIEAQK